MGKKGWFAAMKKVVITPSLSKINKKDQKRSRKSSKSNPKNSWYSQMCLDTCSSSSSNNPFNEYYHPTAQFKLPENEQIKHVDSVMTYATTTTKDVAEVDTSANHLMICDETREEMSAIKIQTAYRGYKARRAFRSLRAISRLNLWIQGQAVKLQTTATLKRIQITARVKSQARTRRTRMVQVNETLQRQIIQKYEKVLDKQAFDLSPKSKEQVEAMLKSKQEAAERRKKALTYAYSCQETWRNSQKKAASAAVSPPIPFVNPAWGWIRPWEIIETTSSCSSINRKQPCGRGQISIKSSANSKLATKSSGSLKKPKARPIIVC